MNCYLHRIPKDEEELLLLSPLDSEQLAEQGMKEKFFIGSLIEPIKGAVDGNIRYNSSFLLLLHEAVRDTMVNHPDVEAEASSQPNGFVFIVDRRAPEGKEVIKEDIIGVFLVNEKKTDVSRYRPNPDYRIIGQHGFCRLPEAAEKILLELLFAPGE